MSSAENEERFAQIAKQYTRLNDPKAAPLEEVGARILDMYSQPGVEFLSDQVYFPTNDDGPGKLCPLVAPQVIRAMFDDNAEALIAAEKKALESASLLVGRAPPQNADKAFENAPRQVRLLLEFAGEFVAPSDSLISNIKRIQEKLSHQKHDYIF